MTDLGSDVGRGEEPLDDDLKAFVDGELPALKRGRIRWRMSRSPELREEVAALRRIGDQLRDSDQARPDPGLRARILANLPPQAIETEARSEVTHGRRDLRRFRPAFGVALALFGIAGAFALTRQLASPPTTTPVGALVVKGSRIGIAARPMSKPEPKLTYDYPIEPAATDGTAGAADKLAAKRLAEQQVVDERSAREKVRREAETGRRSSPSASSSLGLETSAGPATFAASKRHALERAPLSRAPNRTADVQAQPEIRVTLEVADIDAARRALADYARDMPSLTQTRELAMSANIAQSIGRAAGGGVAGSSVGAAAPSLKSPVARPSARLENGAGTNGAGSGRDEPPKSSGGFGGARANAAPRALIPERIVGKSLAFEPDNSHSNGTSEAARKAAPSDPGATAFNRSANRARMDGEAKRSTLHEAPPPLGVETVKRETIELRVPVAQLATLVARLKSLGDVVTPDSLALGPRGTPTPGSVANRPAKPGTDDELTGSRRELGKRFVTITVTLRQPAATPNAPTKPR